jgi:hypothetical protein
MRPTDASKKYGRQQNHIFPRSQDDPPFGHWSLRSEWRLCQLLNTSAECPVVAEYCSRGRAALIPDRGRDRLGRVSSAVGCQTRPSRNPNDDDDGGDDDGPARPAARPHGAFARFL